MSKERQQKNYSTIQDHNRQGKKLLPIWSQYPNMRPVSWRNDRLPDMLWAILLVTLLPRDHALKVFLQVVEYINRLPEDEKFSDVTHTGLSKLPSKHVDEVLSIILAREEQKQVLTPLLLLDNLPGRETWAKVLGVHRIVDDWKPLMIAVARTLDHQSPGVNGLPLAETDLCNSCPNNSTATRPRNDQGYSILP